jgi:hypothetical protein
MPEKPEWTKSFDETRGRILANLEDFDRRLREDRESRIEIFDRIGDLETDIGKLGMRCEQTDARITSLQELLEQAINNAVDNLTERMNRISLQLDHVPGNSRWRRPADIGSGGVIAAIVYGLIQYLVKLTGGT